MRKQNPFTDPAKNLLRQKRNPFYIWNHLNCDELDRYFELQEDMKITTNEIELEMISSVLHSLVDIARERYEGGLIFEDISCY